MASRRAHKPRGLYVACRISWCFSALWLLSITAYPCLPLCQLGRCLLASCMPQLSVTSPTPLHNRCRCCKHWQLRWQQLPTS